MMVLSSECQGFNDDWRGRKIESITAFMIPVTYGTIIPIRCVGGYGKLSGPDAVTCIANTTFHGLDDVSCLGEYLITSFR